MVVLGFEFDHEEVGCRYGFGGWAGVVQVPLLQYASCRWLVVYRYSCYSMLVVGWCCAGATVAVHRCRVPHSGDRRVLAFYIGMRGIITK